MPPPTPSNQVSDHEEDPDDDHDGAEVDDPEILADLPDDTDVRLSFPPSQNDVIADLVSYLCAFARVTRSSTLYTHD